MSMLAEPRRRNKWSLNPRGASWSNDQNKLGQKLLEMMGWSRGKGLGRDEQGQVEPVRLNYKCDTKGMGFKGHDDGWLAHKEEFSEILNQLNGTDNLPKDDEAIAVKSLESRSKSSKARVHYHKFTRGKDLSRYSAEDLACILGTRNSTKEEEAVIESVQDEEPAKSEKYEVEHSHGYVTIHKGNIQDYFASKMAAMRSKLHYPEAQAESGEMVESCVDQEEQMEVFEEPSSKKRVRFNEDLNVVNEFSAKMRILAETPKEEKKKKKKRKDVTVEEATPVEGKEVEKEGPVEDQTPGEEENCSMLEVKAKSKKKKKKDRKEKDEEEEKGNECSAAEVMEVNEGAAAVKKKAKKMRNGLVDEVTSDDVSEVKQIDAAGVEQEPKRKEKKKKKKKMEEESGAEELGQGRKEESVVEVSESSDGDKSQKKKRKKDAAAADAVQPAESEKKKKKKKKKAAEEMLAASDQDCASSVEQRHEMRASDEAIEMETAAGDGANPVTTSKKDKKEKKQLEPEQGTKRKKSDGLDSSAVPLKKLKRDDDEMEPETEVDAAQKSDKPQSKKPDFSYLGSNVKAETLKKAESKFMSSNFDLFKGANLHSITGYGYV